jgi:hypothetical protein
MSSDLLALLSLAILKVKTALRVVAAPFWNFVSLAA